MVRLFLSLAWRWESRTCWHEELHADELIGIAVMSHSSNYQDVRLICLPFSVWRTDPSQTAAAASAGNPAPGARRMVAIFDYDPRESSPNTDIEVRLVHAWCSYSREHTICVVVVLFNICPVCYGSVQAELTFSAGDIIHVFGDMDEDGFFYVSVNMPREFEVICFLIF